MEVLQDIEAAPKYYTETATKEYILEAYRLLAANKVKTAKPLAEQAYAVAQFAADLISESITPAQIDYAFEIWRKRPDDFMPNQGQVLSIINNAGFSKPTMGTGERYAERLRLLIDPNFKPRERQKFVGARTAPKPPTDKLSTEERLAVIERVNRRIGKLGGELKPKTFGKTDADKQRRKDLFLASNQHELRIVDTPSPEGGPIFYAIIGIEKDGKTSTPIRTEIKRADADAFVEEARAL